MDSSFMQTFYEAYAPESKWGNCLNSNQWFGKNRQITSGTVTLSMISTIQIEITGICYFTLIFLWSEDLFPTRIIVLVFPLLLTTIAIKWWSLYASYWIMWRRQKQFPNISPNDHFTLEWIGWSDQGFKTSKEFSEFFASKLKENNLLQPWSHFAGLEKLICFQIP